MRKFKEINPSPRTLMTPGPVEADPRVLRAMSAHILGQFDPEFTELMNETMEMERYVFQTKNRQTYLVDTTSRGGLETVLTGAICPGDKVLIPAFGRFGYLLAEILERCGAQITLLEKEWGTVFDPQEVEDALKKDSYKAVACIHGETSTSMMQPLKEIGEICRKHKVLFHTDAVQAAGHIPVNVKKQNIDMLSLSAHKFHGPRGIGALYVKRGIELISLMEGGGQERGKRPGTENLPAIMGMAAALKEECTLMEQNETRVTAMRDRLIQGLSQIPYSILNGSREKRLPGNVNFCFEGVSGESLLLLLDSRGICASSGSACASGALDPSHVLLSLGLAPEIAQGSLRISLDISNTEEEIDYMLEVIPQVVEQLRGMSDDWRKKHCED